MNARRTSMRRQRRTGSRRAFTLVEILISLALLAMLMTAMCAAVASTIDNVQVTQSASESTARAKLALGQVAGAVRKATTVVLTSPTRLDIVDENGAAGAFKFDATTGQLQYEHGTPVVSSVLAREVKGIKFTAESEPDPETQVMRIVRLTLGMTVKSVDVNGPGTLNYTISAAPRRARSYQ